MLITSSPPPSLPLRVASLRTAQRAWERLPLADRLRPVRALRHLFATECDRLCAAVAKDVGKPVEEIIGGELLPTADACRFLEKEAARLLHSRRVPRSLRPLWLWGQTDTICRRPRGIVGIIGTWNYPVFLNGVQIAQALVAGNSVLWKPSEVAPASAVVLHDLFLQAGFPPGVFEMMEPTRENGQALTEADVDHVVFTGSAEVGRRIAARLGERLISSTLELSGIDAQFVLKDADLSLAARAAWFGATINRGQTCIAVRRAFVDRSRYPAFCESLAQMAVDAPAVSLMSSNQVEHMARLVRDAIGRGGRLLNPLRDGFGDGGSTSCRPVVIADARPEMALCREASFAPILAVLPFDDIEQALAMDEQCPFALGASIFTRDVRLAEKLSPALRAGVVTINDAIAPTAHPATPFGGHGQSGWGVTQGAEGLLEMTAPRTVSKRTDTFRPHYDMAAGGDGRKHVELLRGLLESSHAPTLARRVRGWRRLIGAACGFTSQRDS